MLMFLNWLKLLWVNYRNPSKFTEYQIFKNHLGHEYIVVDGCYYDVLEVINKYKNCYITVNSKNVRVLKFYQDELE